MSTAIITTIKDGAIVLPKKLSSLWRQGEKVRIEPLTNTTVILTKLADRNGSVRPKADEEIWNSVRKSARAIRKEVFKEFYPSLYGSRKTK